ncbi:MAG TPA: CPBP family glutamic-type intramembrane protease [Phycisphaerae bacterium]|nr:CPBP family glutamic-type intramembrane protease [Phycisphaerae bacterium]
MPHPGLAHPLDSLVFLLPLILFYEIGALYLQPSLTDDRQGRVVAFQLLRMFFELFGPTGRWMPGLAVIAILVGVQIASKQRWRVRPWAVLKLYGEAVLWSIPLLLASKALILAAASEPNDGLWSEMILSVGAGVYEELVFRLILICVVVMVGSDLLRFPAGRTTAVAVVLSALLFAAHHHPPVGSEPFETARFAFRLMAGAYLGAIFVYRGYAAAAGTHVAYNLIIVGLAA